MAGASHAFKPYRKDPTGTPIIPAFLPRTAGSAAKGRVNTQEVRQ
jgi:hypothetical protein